MGILLHSCLWWQVWGRFPSVSIEGPIASKLFASCENGVCRVSSSPSATDIAQAEYTRKMPEYGMDRVTVRAKGGKCDTDAPKMYMAGFLEATLTVSVIEDFAYNTANSGAWKSISPKDEAAVRQWWSDMEKFMESKSHCLTEFAAGNRVAECSYLYQVVLAYYQLKGMTDGYNAQRGSKHEKMTTFDFFRINSDGAINGIVAGVAALSSRDPSGDPKAGEQMGRCSALVKLVDNDIYMGHATWEGYEEMVRIWKFYDFDICGATAKQLSFSSYPGAITSTDDFYITSPTKLGIQETTLSNSGGWGALRVHLVPDAFHIMAAVRMAKNGKHFTELLMDNENTKMSGMYNSQWMVVDYALLDQRQPGKQLVPNTFMVVEAAPGLGVIKDETEKLEKDKFWGSVNHPAYEQIARALGEVGAVEQTARWKIFNEHQSGIKTIDDMKWMMRFARKSEVLHGKKREYSLDSTISARYDIDANSLQGGVDAKIVDRNAVSHMEVLVQAGPSHENLPPFDFSGSSVPHRGIPDGPLNWPWFIVDQDSMRTLVGLAEDRISFPDQSHTLGSNTLLVVYAPIFGTVIVLLVLWACFRKTATSKEDAELRAPFGADFIQSAHYGGTRNLEGQA